MASRAPTRQQFKDFLIWLQDEIHAEGVDLRLSTYVTEDDLASFDADHVILATGAEPRMDGLQMPHPGEPIDGIDLGHVASSNDLFHNPSATPATHALERLNKMDFTYHVGTRALMTDGQSAKLQAVTGGGP